MEADRPSRFQSPLESLTFVAYVGAAVLLNRVFSRPKKAAPLPPPVKTPPPVALVRGQRCGFPLVSKLHLSHDTVLLRFGLPSEQHVLGLPAGQHLFCYATTDGETLVRAYSTVTPPETQGYFEIALKVYYPEPPKYPEGGKMSQHLASLNEGDVVEFKGPVGRFVYEGEGMFAKNRKSKKATKISMIAGGTGINPFIQILRKILDNPHDMTQVSLIYANKSEKDILFRHELDQLACKHWNFSLFYTVEQPSWHWTHGRGRVNQKMLERHLFEAEDDSVLLLCGPGPMTDAVSAVCTDSLGWSKDQISVF